MRQKLIWRWENSNEETDQRKSLFRMNKSIEHFNFFYLQIERIYRFLILEVLLTDCEHGYNTLVKAFRMHRQSWANWNIQYDMSVMMSLQKTHSVCFFSFVIRTLRSEEDSKRSFVVILSSVRKPQMNAFSVDWNKSEWMIGSFFIILFFHSIFVSLSCEILEKKAIRMLPFSEIIGKRDH